jgi:hypothetical protein
MGQRTFVQLNADDNVFSILQSDHPPGELAATPEEEVLPDDVREVTDLPEEDWLTYKWDGSALVPRDDL